MKPEDLNTLSGSHPASVAARMLEQSLRYAPNADPMAAARERLVFGERGQRFNAWLDPRRPRPRNSLSPRCLPPLLHHPDCMCRSRAVVVAEEPLGLRVVSYPPGFKHEFREGVLHIIPIEKPKLPLYTDDEGFIHPLSLMDEPPRQQEAHYKAVRKIEQN